MAISDKLLLLNNTKQQIRQAIESLGYTVGDIPFSQYPDVIDSMVVTEGGDLFQQGQALNYNFTDQRYGTKPPDGSVTYTTNVNDLGIVTRASTATYWGPEGMLVEAAVDEARIQHDPVTGGALGLLVESSATNVASYSQGPPGGWTASRDAITLTEGGTILGLPSVRASGVDVNFGYISSGVSFSAPPDEGLSVSFLVRPLTPELSNGHRLLWLPSSETMWFWGADYDNGILYPTSNAPDINGSIVLIDDDTYLIRLELPSESLPEQESGSIRILPDRINIYPGRVGSITEVTAVQVEDASSSSYIPTIDSPVTRAADNAVIDLSDVLNPDEGTYVVRAVVKDDGDVEYYAGWYDSQISERFAIRRISGGIEIVADSSPAGYREVFSVPGEVQVGDVITIAMAYSDGECVGSAFGEVVRDSSGGFLSPSSINLVRGVGGTSAQYNASLESSGVIAGFEYYPRALTEEELARITAFTLGDNS